MTGVIDLVRQREPAQRQEKIVEVLVAAFSELMTADPKAFRQKFRKMAVDPFAFYRGTACLFYADMEREEDRWSNERTGRVWIQGDLHAENFGTYMAGDGVFVFDVNDFDEAYLGHYTWDLQRLAASVSLLGWRKAFADADIETLVADYARAYLNQVRWFVETAHDASYSLRLDTTDGVVHEVLQRARLRSRETLLDSLTETEGYDRRFRESSRARHVDDDEHAKVRAAFARYLDTIPKAKRFRSVTYEVKDVVASGGFGIGSAGLPAYTVLIEGFNEALDNDVVLSIKQGNVAAPSRVVTDERIAAYFEHHGHRTAVSQRALQARADPLLGYTELDGAGYVVSELSPYESDLDWDDLTEPDEIAPVLDYLGRATAKVHCVADSDSDQNLVSFQTEEAIASAVDNRDDEFVAWLVEFAHDYSAVVRDDHRLFVEAFRSGEIAGVSSTRYRG
ncbi:MAG: DUF2252 domain-containing protein [Streptosporangiales bacterium]